MTQLSVSDSTSNLTENSSDKVSIGALMKVVYKNEKIFIEDFLVKLLQNVMVNVKLDA